MGVFGPWRAGFGTQLHGFCLRRMTRAFYRRARIGSMAGRRFKRLSRGMHVCQ
jgi:hypothetical protein